jgi:hypothetical protein
MCPQAGSRGSGRGELCGKEALPTPASGLEWPSQVFLGWLFCKSRLFFPESYTQLPTPQVPANPDVFLLQGHLPGEKNG